MSGTLNLERYLGLKTSSKITTPHEPIDPEKSPPFPMLADVVFIAIDIESFEHAHHKVTEIGLSILDTRDLVTLVPSSSGSSWFSAIKSRHIRIKEHAHLINKRFVHGCPEKFNFGTSEFVSLRQLPNFLASMFQSPSMTSTPSQTNPRSIILVGHSLHNDTAYLNQLGFSPSSHAQILEHLDTQRLCGSTKKAPLGLVKLCTLLGIETRDLHNAGNDAAYTLQAMLAIAVSEATRPGWLRGEILKVTKNVQGAAALPEGVKSKTQMKKEARKEARKVAVAALKAATTEQIAAKAQAATGGLG